MDNGPNEENSFLFFIHIVGVSLLHAKEKKRLYHDYVVKM